MRLFKTFFEDQKGSVAITFGVAVVPIVLAMGIGLDFVQASQLQARFLMAADNAGLAAAASEETDAGKLKAIVEKYLTRNGAMSGNFSKPKVNVETLKDGNLKIQLSTKMNTSMMRVIGRKTVQVSATTVVSREYGDMDVVLVLDNTGSMEGNKLATLKDAAGKLVNTLHDSTPSGNVVKIGLVPFADYVNIGMSNRNKSWADIDPDSTKKVLKKQWVKNITHKSNCRWVSYVKKTDGGKVHSQYHTCDYVYGPKILRERWKTVGIKWSGCVGSRNYPWNTLDERTSLRVPGIMDRTCGQELTELTDSRSDVLQRIKWMRPKGATYIPTGLMWGWRVVSEGLPFDNNHNATSTKSHQRAIVLMTDGENTVSPRYPDHGGRNKTEANRLTSEICNNIKSSKENITIYTVAFEVNDVRTKDLLRSCATSPSYYFNASNSSQLSASFQKIAKSLAQLRIAQ